ncbi:MAG: flippase activity-associated protein Agl23 [Verrucomicrobiia bacterium]
MQKVETKARSSTAKPVFNSSFFIRHSAFVLIALSALAVRLPRLGERPMHTDEAVNAYIVGQLLAGEPFRYDPQDRHGPALAAETLPVVKCFRVKKFADLKESQLRLVPVLTGAATVLMFGAGVEMFGFSACLVAALLFAFAPLTVYYNRYFIHETLFVAATWGLMLSGWPAVLNKSYFSAAFAGGCAALMLACKETAVLHFFGLGLAGLAGWILSSPKKAVAGLVSPKITLTAFVVFLFVVILLFTWFGRNWHVFANGSHAAAYSAARAAGEGHEKPIWYYLRLLGGGGSGGILLGLAALGIFGVLARSFRQAKSGPPDARFFLAIYALVIWVIYSAIPYKTPWLALNFWLPLAIFAGLGGEWLWQRASAVRRLFWAVVVALGLLLVNDTWHRAFANPAGEMNPFAYAHTSEDLLRLPPRLAELARQNKLSDPRIAVVAADAWPLPWYLRRFSQVGYWQPGQETGVADFFITPPDVSGPLAARLKNFRPEYFGVRPDVLLVLWSPLEIAPHHE